MGFLDDSDSESEMGDMSCSNVSMSFRRVSEGPNSHCRRGALDDDKAPGKFKFGWDESGLSVSKSDKESFRFGWDDSVSSVGSDDDLDESVQSSFMNASYSRTRGGQSATPLGRVLEQVDGVQYKDPNNKHNKGGLLSQLYGARDDSSEEEEEEEELFLPVPAVQKVVEKLVPVVPQRVITIKFLEPIVTDQLNFVQDEDAALAVWDEHHVAEDHNQIPWDELEYEELPWHLQPDLDDDDPLTKICRTVLFGEKPTNEEEEEEVEEEEQELPLEDRRHLDRVEALVIYFSLKLKNRRLQTRRRLSAKSLCSTGTSMTADSSGSSEEEEVDARY